MVPGAGLACVACGVMAGMTIRTVLPPFAADALTEKGPAPDTEHSIIAPPMPSVPTMVLCASSTWPTASVCAARWHMVGSGWVVVTTQAASGEGTVVPVAELVVMPPPAPPPPPPQPAARITAPRRVWVDRFMSRILHV